MALIDEARSKIRVIRGKLIHREYIRELDTNNRLLSIGKTSDQYYKSDADKVRLKIVISS